MPLTARAPAPVASDGFQVVEAPKGIYAFIARPCRSAPEDDHAAVAEWPGLEQGAVCASVEWVSVTAGI